MFAAINMHKPQGMTSHDVVSRLRRIYGLKKIGHLGTLDPMAEGVLPLCLGQATRLIEYFETDKRYTAEVTLGRTTDTLDAEGSMLTEADCSGLDVSPARLEEVLAPYRGTFMQQVPMYSAVHVEGKRLYDLARQGKAAKPPSREVTIHTLDLLEVREDEPAHPVLVLDISCSSGTYIRSLARDIGEALGCGATLTALVRTEHGCFALKDSVTLETLQVAEDPRSFLLDPVSFLAIPTFEVPSAHEARLLSNGIKLNLHQLPSWQPNWTTALALFERLPLAVVVRQADLLKPSKVFPPELLANSTK